jgi:hypothetical protein
MYPYMESNLGPIDYKSKSLLKFPFINVDISNFWNPRQASKINSLQIHYTLN